MSKRAVKRIDMRLNTIPPAMKDRDRYIVFEIVSRKVFEPASIVQALWNSCMQLFGEVGVSEFSMAFLSNLYDKTKKIGIIKCNHNSVEKIRLAIASIKNIEDEPVVIKTIGLTGTISSAKSKFLNIHNLEDFSEKKEKDDVVE